MEALQVLNRVEEVVLTSLPIYNFRAPMPGNGPDSTDTLSDMLKLNPDALLAFLNAANFDWIHVSSVCMPPTLCFSPFPSRVSIECTTTFTSYIALWIESVCSIWFWVSFYPHATNLASYRWFRIRSELSNGNGTDHLRRNSCARTIDRL